MQALIEGAPRLETRAARAARLIAKKRSRIFAPIFIAAFALGVLRPSSTVPREVMIAATGVVFASWLLRIWATGYRSWVHKDGVDRHHMSAGPYAHVRHPLYVANGVAGGAALVVWGQLELLAVYGVLYLLVTSIIVRREEDALVGRFRSVHAEYRAQVPAFFPLPGHSMPRERREGRFAWAPVHRGHEVGKLAVIVVLFVWFLSRG